MTKYFFSINIWLWVFITFFQTSFKDYQKVSSLRFYFAHQIPYSVSLTHTAIFTLNLFRSPALFLRSSENCGYVMIMKFLNLHDQFYNLCFLFDYFIWLNFIFLSFCIRNGICSCTWSAKFWLPFFPCNILPHFPCTGSQGGQSLFVRMAHQIVPNKRASHYFGYSLSFNQCCFPAALF